MPYDAVGRTGTGRAGRPALRARSGALSATFLSERYERRSVILTSNLVFSQWDKIFKDPMTTAAAIDRVVHLGDSRQDACRFESEASFLAPFKEELHGLLTEVAAADRPFVVLLGEERDDEPQDACLVREA